MKTKWVRPIAIVSTIWAVAACSPKQAYQAIQYEQQQRCQLAVLDDERNECDKQSNMSYEEYQRHRKKIDP